MHFQLGDVFYKYYRKTIESSGDAEKCIRGLKLLLDGLIGEVTKAENISFSTGFSRYAYALYKFRFPGKYRFYIHNFRHRVERKNFSEETLVFAKRLIPICIEQITEVEIPEDIAETLQPFPNIGHRNEKPKAFFKELRVYIMADVPEKSCFQVETEIEGSTLFSVPYNVPGENESFTKTVELVRKHYEFPVTLNLIDVKLNSENELLASMMVLEPDNLIGVTYISGCFKNRQVEPRLDILNKFSQRTSSIHLLIGNIANFFLDELMFDSSQTFPELFPKVFHLAPLQFAMLDNKAVRTVMEESKKHFVTIKKMIDKDLKEHDINKEDCYLEPTFYAPKYGIQGRLDLLHAPDIAEKSAIIELKSGKVYDPNRHGLNQDHYIQTLCYDMLIERSLAVQTEIGKYIFYSKYYDNPLRHAPSIKSEKMSALQVRNELIAQERILARTFPDDLYAAPLFESISPLKIKLSGFIQDDIRSFENVYKSLTTLEKSYFLSFAGFITREQIFSKIGNSYSHGGASLWLDTVEEKEKSYAIINYLQIMDLSEVQTSDARLVLHKTELTNQLANFRVGDRVVLYPNVEGKSPLELQLYKGTLVEISDERIILKLASKQFNHKYFKNFQYWNIERDSLDSSFNKLYESLYQWANQKPERRALLLGQTMPAPSKEVLTNSFEGTTEEQAHILNKIIASQDYFLLWGPPGTGKTSVMVRHLVEYYLKYTDEKILLLAYTNRAVDELCAAIESIDSGDIRDQYFRIGSRYAVDPAYRQQLLGFKTKDIDRRSTLKDFIGQHRIVVATLSSLQSRRELLDLLKFNRVIIDEASQVIEPMIIGFLGQFEHFTLIGDHQQLPAVVVQPENLTKVKNAALENLGITDLRNSYFERLFNRLNTLDLNANFAMLSMQGRMHEEIMEFPSEYFYNNKLRVLPPPLNTRQLQKIPARSIKDELFGYILNRRVSFIDIQPKTMEASKTNEEEAQMIVKIIEKLSSEKDYDTTKIGIITPFRAQIAKIRRELEKKNLYCKSLMIDTVERYQGGAKDLIIISLCITHPLQLKNLVSKSSDGIDRKFNVALTRAREQLILLGNVNIFEEDKYYKKYIENYLVIPLRTNS